jgi:hypothetical protein
VVKRYRLLQVSANQVNESPDGEWVRWEDHEQEVQAQRKIGYARGDYDGKVCPKHGHEKVCPEYARREAFREARDEYLKITRGNPLSFLTFEEWLTKQAEGRGE